jgi:hypothetical protein
LKDEDKGIRCGIVEENAAGEGLLKVAMSIIVAAMIPEGHGCAEHARRGNVGISQDMRQAANRREFPPLSHRINVLTPISRPYVT